MKYFILLIIPVLWLGCAGSKEMQKVDELKKIHSLNYIALTTGGTDIDVEFVARSLVEFKTLIFEKICQIDGVNSAETSLIVEIVKDTWDYGTAWDPK